MTLPSARVGTAAMPRGSLLAACHVNRSQHYRLTGKLLSTPPDEATLATVRSLLSDHTSHLGEDRSLHQLRAAVENAWTTEIAEEFVALFPPQHASSALRCDAPDSWVLALACGTTNVQPSALRTTEIETLAILAEKTAWALAAAERSLLASLMDIQRRLVVQHSARCLGHLARDLEFSSGTFYGRVGLALRWRLEEDAWLLALDAASDDHVTRQG